MFRLTSTEIIKKLFIAFSKKDEEEFYRLGEELIALEKRKKHNVVAKELKEALFSYSNSSNQNVSKRFKPNLPIPRDNDSGFPLLEIQEYYLDFDDLILSENNKYVLTQLIREIKVSEVLAVYNLKPKNKLLFSGEPGTGKTFTAQVISSVLQLPLVYIRFDAIISSYLGETATNLRKVFDFIKNGRWVVLFDEVDIIGKNRNDEHESGEIKRVVNNFLQMIDQFQGDSLIISATNHPHILDPAIWRRFDEVINFELPDEMNRRELFNKYLKVMKREKEINIDDWSKKTNGFSPSDIKGMCKEAMVHAIVNGNDIITTADLEYSFSRYEERMSVRKQGD